MIGVDYREETRAAAARRRVAELPRLSGGANRGDLPRSIPASASPGSATARRSSTSRPRRRPACRRPATRNGNPRYQADGMTPVLVTNFKDAEGRIKRQAARFQVFVYDDALPEGPAAQDRRPGRRRRQSPARWSTSSGRSMSRTRRRAGTSSSTTRASTAIRDGSSAAAMPTSPTASAAADHRSRPAHRRTTRRKRARRVRPQRRRQLCDHLPAARPDADRRSTRSAR